MANDTAELTAGANGKVWVAPVGSDEPADEIEELDPAWLELGLLTDDGVEFTDGKTVKNIGAWQLFNPARRLVTARTTKLNFQMEQWNSTTISLGFGGGSVTEPTPGHFKYTPPPAQTRDERAMIVEWSDGDKHYRVVVPKGSVTEDTKTKIARTDIAVLPIGFEALGVEDADPWYLLTDDESLGEIS